MTTGKTESRYDTSNTGWPEIPAITRIEAERASAKLAKHFKFRAGRVRRVWITATQPYDTLNRGWRRLVHDLSHRWFSQTYPNKRPHDALHSRYESDMVKFVLEQGWLSGSLKPKLKPKPTVEDRRQIELRRTDESIKRWTSKARRAETALRKLERKRRRLTAEPKVRGGSRGRTLPSLLHASRRSWREKPQGV